MFASATTNEFVGLGIVCNDESKKATLHVNFASTGIEQVKIGYAIFAITKKNSSKPMMFLKVPED